MAIHYRVISSDIYQSKIYRSLNSARKDCAPDQKVIAFQSRKDALNMSDIHLHVRSCDQAPELIANYQINRFEDWHLDAKGLNPKYPPRGASDRRRLEEKYNWRLFGFDTDGRAIDAEMWMSVSCRWIRYKCPIWINNKKSNIKGLMK
tara:strand:+ start:153 stop:596 length:444 start_codon:yes stop_codon:yes gene_type:complete